MHSALDSQSLCLSSTPDRSWFFLFPSWPEYEFTIIMILVGECSAFFGERERSNYVVHYLSAENLR